MNVNLSIQEYVESIQNSIVHEFLLLWSQSFQKYVNLSKRKQLECRSSVQYFSVEQFVTSMKSYRIQCPLYVSRDQELQNFIRGFEFIVLCSLAATCLPTCYSVPASLALLPSSATTVLKLLIIAFLVITLLRLPF